MLNYLFSASAISLYFRFTMFENGGNLTHYINEDSFFVPPDFNKDPQFDWNPPAAGSGSDGGSALVSPPQGPRERGAMGRH